MMKRKPKQRKAMIENKQRTLARHHIVQRDSFVLKVILESAINVFSSKNGELVLYGIMQTRNTRLHRGTIGASLFHS